MQWVRKNAPIGDLNLTALPSKCLSEKQLAKVNLTLDAVQVYMEGLYRELSRTLGPTASLILTFGIDPEQYKSFSQRSRSLSRKIPFPENGTQDSTFS
jgi:hypothetical protein